MSGGCLGHFLYSDEDSRSHSFEELMKGVGRIRVLHAGLATMHFAGCDEKHGGSFLAGAAGEGGAHPEAHGPERFAHCQGQGSRGGGGVDAQKVQPGARGNRNTRQGKGESQTTARAGAGAGA